MTEGGVVVRSLHGRNHELGAALRHLRSGLSAGTARMVCVSGVSGVGLTALHDAIVEQARRAGCLVASGAAVDPRSADGSPGATYAAPPYSTLARALWSATDPVLSREEFTELEALHDRPIWLLDRLAAALEARARQHPVLVAVDDAQWADPASVYALKLLPSRLRSLPVLWLITGRAGSVVLDEIVAAVETEVPVEALEPEPLTTVAIRELTAERLGFEPSPPLDRMIQGAGGHPGLLVRLLDRLDHDTGVSRPVATTVGHEVLPAAFVACLRGRIDADLDAAAAEAMFAAAVLGPCTVDDLAAALEQPARRILGPVELLVARGYLTGGDGLLTFGLELVRAGAYASLPEVVRRAMHRDALRRLADRGAKPHELAPHVVATAAFGDRDAVALLQLAAAEVRDPEESLRLLRRARELVDPAQPVRNELTAAVIDQLRVGHRWSEAVAEYRRHPSVPATAAAIAPVLAGLGLTDELRSSALPTEHAVARALHRRADATNRLLVGDAGVAVTELAEVARRLDTVVVEEFRASLGLDDLHRAEQWIARNDAPGREALVGLGRAALLLVTGDATAAAAEAERSVLEATRTGQDDVVLGARDVQARVSLLRGRLDEAAALAVTPVDGVPDAPAAWTGLVPAVVSTLRGDAAAGARRVRRLLERRPVALSGPEDLVLAHRVASLAGDVGLARSLTAVATGRQSSGELAAAVAGHLSGLDDGDAGACRESERWLRDSPRQLMHAFVAEDLGGLLVASGRPDEAVESLDGAWTRYAEMGADGAADEVRRLLRQAGVRRRRMRPEPDRAAAGWEALTDAELRVALLVADGLSNREVASALVVSPHTVSTLLRAVYAKLGIGRRVQLARLAVDRAG